MHSQLDMHALPVTWEAGPDHRAALLLLQQLYAQDAGKWLMLQDRLL